MDFPSWQDLFRRERDEALVKNGKLSLDVIERDGTDANILLAAGAAAADEVIGQLVQVESGLFLDSAQGQVLDRLVFDRYNMLRKQAATAQGQVNFTTTTPNPSPFTILAGTLVQSTSGTQFVTTADALFMAGITGPVIVPVRSILAGLDQQAAPNTITNIIGQITGSPSDLVVDNPLATAGADDAEDDPSLRARARQFFVTARRGTSAAIVQGALAVPGVRTASLFEVIGGNGHPAGEVQLVITDAYTDSLASFTPTPGSYALQSQVLAQQVFSGLADVRAAGVFVDVIVAVVEMLPIVLHLTFQAGADVPAVTTQAIAVAVGYTNSLAPGETFVPGALETQLRTVSGLIPTGNEVASPNGNVVPLTLQVIRTSQQIVTAPSV